MMDKCCSSVDFAVDFDETSSDDNIAPVSQRCHPVFLQNDHSVYKTETLRAKCTFNPAILHVMLNVMHCPRTWKCANCALKVSNPSTKSSAMVRLQLLKHKEML